MIVPTPPSEFNPSIPTSSSQFVSRRSVREYIPDGPSVYEQQSSDKIIFTLNSADSFWDATNSYIRFKLGITTGTGTNFTAQDQVARYLASGGAHALFKNLTISLSNGTSIEQIERYSDLYHIIKSWTMSRDHVTQVEHTAADSVFNAYRDRISPLGNQWTVVDNQNGVLALTTLTGVLTGFTGIGAADIQVGDELCVVLSATNATNRTPTIVYCRVRSIETDNNLTVEGHGSAIDIAAAGNTGIQIVYKWNRPTSARARGASQVVASATTAPGNDIIIKMKPLSNFLMNSKYVPLCFLKNLRIELTLNRAAHCLVVSKQNVNGTIIAPQHRVVLGDVRYVCNLVTPSEPLMNEFIKMYNGDGILYNYISYQYNLKVIEGSVSESVVIPSSCRSCLTVISAQYMDYSESVSGDAWSTDTIATTIKGNVIEWYYQLGSELYPMNKALAYGQFNGDTFNHCQQAFASHASKYECNSIIPEEYYPINTVLRQDVAAGANLTNESLRFIMAARLDRTGPYSGVDIMSSNDLQLNILRSAPVSGGGVQIRPYLRSYLVHNRSLSISKNGSVVFS
jgi:hypothetical protein